MSQHSVQAGTGILNGTIILPSNNCVYIYMHMCIYVGNTMNIQQKS